MAICVVYKPVEKSVVINGHSYTLQELERKLFKSKSELGILNTLKEYIKELPNNIAQLEIEYDDISELVKSDMFKGDNHSMALLPTGTGNQVFWEQN